MTRSGSVRCTMRFDRRLLGWGAFFILLGVIPLAVQQGYLDKELVSRWFSLWPLLLIGWGLGLVLRETPVEWLGGAVTTLTFGVMGGSLIATGFGGVPFSIGCRGDDGRALPEQRGTLAAGGAVSVTLPCGELTISGVDGSDWSLSGTAGEDDAPVVRSSGGDLEIRGPERVSFGPEGPTIWNVGLPREPANVELSLTLNAGKGSVDLEGLQLAAVGFTLNAGELNVKAADVATLASLNGTVNAGSANLALPGDLAAGFTVNAGSLTICLPEDTAVRVEATSTLGSTNLDELDLDKVGDDTWESPGYSSAAAQVELRVTTNAGSFELAIGGGCGA